MSENAFRKKELAQAEHELKLLQIEAEISPAEDESKTIPLFRSKKCLIKNTTWPCCHICIATGSAFAVPPNHQDDKTGDVIFSASVEYNVAKQQKTKPT
ncbi:hypothetical protein O9993_11430 [Vibrio lentus]|nr:hypothetical protein [Vibrio lentus]